MVAIASALGSEHSDQWIEAMCDSKIQEEMLRAATERAKSSRSSAF